MSSNADAADPESYCSRCQNTHDLATACWKVAGEPRVDLTDFLTARIDEDRQWVREQLEAPQMDIAPNWWVAYNQIHPRRIRDECTAKNQLIAIHEPSNDSPTHCLEDGEAHPCDTLRAVVMAYADHPDFDPAWRVQQGFDGPDELCHCGEPVDSSEYRNRGMCTHCDSTRCDANPGECGRPDG